MPTRAAFPSLASFSSKSGDRAELPPRYSRASDADVAFFRSVVGNANVRTDADSLSAASTDWLRQYRGAAAAVVRPARTEEVAALLRHCHARRIPVVPQSGNTGLVGGSVPLGHEVVLSLERMNRVLSVDAASGAVVAEAGCVLQRLDEELEQHGLMMPLDLGAKGSCMIGGNVSTNAGGLRLLRWGSLHGSVLGLVAVLADGTVVDTLSTLRKDNVGYDVKQLFIGSEGTLGVVTAVAIQAVARPASINGACAG